MPKMFVVEREIFLKSGLATGRKRTRCSRQPIVDMDVDCRRARHDEKNKPLFFRKSTLGDLTSRHAYLYGLHMI